jgi:cell pole-organizing protein PopZ
MVDDDGTLVDLGRPALDDDIDAALGDEPLLPPEPRSHHAQPDEGEFIISDHAAAAAAGSLAVLTTAAGRKIADQLGASDIGGVTVEELVRQLLRPMLRDWLDENLPPMVERLVRREIERLAAQGTGRR